MLLIRTSKKLLLILLLKLFLLTNSLFDSEYNIQTTGLPFSEKIKSNTTVYKAFETKTERDKEVINEFTTYGSKFPTSSSLTKIKENTYITQYSEKTTIKNIQETTASFEEIENNESTIDDTTFLIFSTSSITKIKDNQNTDTSTIETTTFRSTTSILTIINNSMSNTTNLTVLKNTTSVYLANSTKNSFTFPNSTENYSEATLITSTENTNYFFTTSKESESTINISTLESLASTNSNLINQTSYISKYPFTTNFGINASTLSNTNISIISTINYTNSDLNKNTSVYSSENSTVKLTNGVKSVTETTINPQTNLNSFTTSSTLIPLATTSFNLNILSTSITDNYVTPDCNPDPTFSKIISTVSFDMFKSYSNWNCLMNIKNNFDLNGVCKSLANISLANEFMFKYCDMYMNYQNFYFKNLTLEKFLTILNRINNSYDSLVFITRPFENSLEYIDNVCEYNSTNCSIISGQFTKVKILNLDLTTVSYLNDELEYSIINSKSINIYFKPYPYNQLYILVVYYDKNNQITQRKIKMNSMNNTISLTASMLNLDTFVGNFLKISLTRSGLNIQDIGLNESLWIEIDFQKYKTIPIQIIIKKTSVESISGIKQIKIMPDKVINLALVNVSSNDAYFTWINPETRFDYIEYECISMSNQIVFSGSFLPPKSLARCSNLSASTQYKFIVRTVIDFNEIIMTSLDSEIIFNTKENTIETANNSINFLNNLLQQSFENLTNTQLSNLITNVGDIFNTTNLSVASTESAAIIGKAADVLSKISNRNTTKESQEVVVNYMNIIDLILNLSLDSLKFAQENSSSSTKFASGIEKIFHKIDLNSYIKSFKNFDVQTTLRNKTSTNIQDFGISSKNKLAKKLNYETFLNNSNSSISGFFNPDIINQIILSGSSVKLTFIAYKTSKFFTSGNIKNFESNELNCNYGKQISPNVLSTYPLNANISNSSSLFTVIFQEQLQEQGCTTKGRNLSFDCVFWDENKNDWNNYGCTHELVKYNQKNSHICVCNHTTSFALLMTADSFPYCEWCEQVLFYVSIIGVCLSIVGLSITIFYDLCISFLPKSKIETYLQSSKSYMMSQYANMSRQYLKIITTWCFVIFALDTVYIAFTFYNFIDTTTDLTSSQKSSCITIGVLLHFFLLSTFFLSLSITIIQYLIFYKSFTIFRFIYLKAVSCSIGASILIVAIVLIIDVNAYINPNRYCWLAPIYSIFAVIVPIAIILCVNLVFFILIAISHHKANRNREKFLNSIVIDQKNVKKEVIFIATCFTNTGLTWLFGFLITIPGSDSWIYIKFVYALIFCILNSTQGFHIFIVYILISKRRHEILKKKLLIKIKELKDKFGAKIY